MFGVCFTPLSEEKLLALPATHLPVTSKSQLLDNKANFIQPTIRVTSLWPQTTLKDGQCGDLICSEEPSELGRAQIHFSSWSLLDRKLLTDHLTVCVCRNVL